MDRISGKEMGWLIALTIVAALLRFHHLGEWPLFGDEVNTIVESRGFASSGDEGELKSWTLSTNALNHLLTGLSYRIFGESLFSARFFPALFGILAIPVFFLLLRKRFSSSVAFLTVLFITFSANHVFLSGFARYNSMLFFFGGAAFLALLNGWMERSTPQLILGATLAMLAVFTHTTGILVVVAFLVFSLGNVLWNPQARKKGLLSMALVAGLFLVVGFIFRHDLFYVARVIARDFVGTGKGYPPIRLAGSIAYNDGVIYALFAVPAAILAFKRRETAAMAVALYWSVPFLLLITASRWMEVGPRYLHSVLPGFYMLAALGVFALWRGKAAVKAVLCLVIIGSQVPLFVSNWIDGGRYDTLSATHFLMERKGESPEEPVFAEGHMIYNYHSNGVLDATELPFTLAQMVSALDGCESALIVFPLQRGVPLGFIGRDYARWLEKNCDLLKRFTTKRIDLMRYEVAVYRYSRPVNRPS